MRCIVVKWLYLQHSHMQSPSLGESPLLAKCEFSKPAADDGVCRMFNDLTAFMRCINGKHVRAPHNQLFYFWDIPTTRCINAFIRLLWLCDDEVNRSVLYTLKRFHYAWSFRYGSSTRNKTTPSFQPPYDVVYHVWLCVLIMATVTQSDTLSISDFRTEEGWRPKVSRFYAPSSIYKLVRRAARLRRFSWGRLHHLAKNGGCYRNQQITSVRNCLI